MPNKGGRPRKQIEKKDLESLLAIQCTLEEVTAFFDQKLDGCSMDTIERFCKREYHKGFAEVAEQKRMIGRIGLRRTQFRLAEKSASMAIFLGKQLLNQTDAVRVESRADGKLADLIDGLRELETDDLHEEAVGADEALAEEQA